MMRIRNDEEVSGMAYRVRKIVLTAQDRMEAVWVTVRNTLVPARLDAWESRRQDARELKKLYELSGIVPVGIPAQRYVQNRIAELEHRREAHV